MDQSQAESAKVLFSHELYPVETVNVYGSNPVILTCEHAGKSIPERLGDLGLSFRDLDRHIAYDIGAEGLSRHLSELLDATLVLQRYSRLVIDCNRPWGAADLIPEISDGTCVPANLGLSEVVRQSRYAAIHQPLHAEIADQIATKKSKAIISVHSFNRTLGTEVRDMHVGLLFNRDARLAYALKETISRAVGAKSVALNRPYSVDDESDETIPRHGEATGLLHVLLEVRNDLIAAEDGQREWANILAASIATAMTAFS